MKNRLSLSSGVIFFVALALVALPAGFSQVSALKNIPERNMEQTVATTTMSSTDPTTTDTQKPETTESTMQARIQEAKDQAKQNVEKIRGDKPTQTASHRQLLCENRQKAINNKISAFTKAADTQMTKLDGAYAKLTSYQSTNNIVVANYGDLTTSAAAKKQIAVDATAALNSVATNIDCTNPEVAVQLSTVKLTAETTRTALRDYRLSLHNILVALAQAAGTAADTTNTDTTTSTGGTN